MRLAPICRLFLVLLLAIAGPARAAYPDHPITLVVPFSAGGPTDTVARDLADALKKLLGVEVLVDNVGGPGGGTLGATKVAKAPPDGYTLLLHHIGMATAPSLYRNLPYDTLNDFEYLGLIAEVPMTLIGRPGLPAGSFAELRQWMLANKGKINLANAGTGAASHLCGVLFQRALKLDMNTVSFKGTAPAMAELLAGNVDLLCDQTTNTTAMINAGKVRAYAVTTRQRLAGSVLATLPTLEEAGLKGFEVSIWHGLYAPKGTPPAVVEKLNTALRAALHDPDFMRREQALGSVLVNDARLTSAGHKRFVAAEIHRWAPIIRAAGPYGED
ncbi:tripartite tricarboxylate transporter substrate-binding protein [Paucibacter sp. R3-3]|uniref:Tripartite tricarboxylate transporter substrate-binding protein n=1 Tax=Roseateles agri TaxID=3098619 RepID=A0ABU5DB41_9BURK|nr:tripartite tricarboxylate transporter substrate-binding protein [Paucibacter sp. R3-3]MDY0743041.1 tripartite tricarboxylate transporter substrate-binding protein [Paucibacter sp. R3-3]